MKACAVGTERLLFHLKCLLKQPQHVSSRLCVSRRHRFIKRVLLFCLSLEVVKFVFLWKLPCFEEMGLIWNLSICRLLVQPSPSQVWAAQLCTLQSPAWAQMGCSADAGRPPPLLALGGVRQLWRPGPSVPLSWYNTRDSSNLDEHFC